MVGLSFTPLKRIYGRIRGTKYISCNNLDGREFIFKLNRYLTEDSSNAKNCLRTQIALLNKKSLKNK